MKEVHREQLLQQLNWRCAAKQFDPTRKISPQDWNALEEALVLTPSSYGLQPWKFIVVEDPAIREQLVPVSWDQRQIADASHLVVFTIKKNLSQADIDAYMDRIVEVRGVARASLAGFRATLSTAVLQDLDEAGRREWAARQVYIALGNFLNSTALLGIDACPLEGIEPEHYDRILGLDRLGLRTVVAATAGYRVAADHYAGQRKVRFPRAEVVLHV